MFTERRKAIAMVWMMTRTVGACTRYECSAGGNCILVLGAFLQANKHVSNSSHNFAAAAISDACSSTNFGQLRRPSSLTRSRQAARMMLAMVKHHFMPSLCCDLPAGSVQ